MMLWKFMLAAHMFNSVRPDGLTIGPMWTLFVMQPMLGERGVLYDIEISDLSGNQL